jgi:hypothetical protein
MARNPNGADYGTREHSPTSTFALDRASPRGLVTAMYPWLRTNVVYVEDDFIEDTISSTRWNLAADGTATTFAWSSAAGGKIAGAAGTTDNGYFAINGDVIWLGDQNAGMEVRFKIDVVTDFTFEIGFTDALSDETLPAVTDVDTPATGNGATDVAVIHLDTDQTLKTAAFVSESTGSTFACQKVNLGTWAPTAAVWYTARVQLAGNNAFCAIFKGTDFQTPVLNTVKGLSTALEGGTLVRPHALFGTRSTADKAVDIDLIRVWMDRP